MSKDKKLFVLDTHAGAGGYDLGGELAGRTGEAEAGIARLAAAPDHPMTVTFPEGEYLKGLVIIKS